MCFLVGSCFYVLVVADLIFSVLAPRLPLIYGVLLVVSVFLACRVQTGAFCLINVLLKKNLFKKLLFKKLIVIV